MEKRTAITGSPEFFSGFVPISPRVFAVFGHFQNLNLLSLMQDLRDGRTAREAWLTGRFLCPVAHGLPHGKQVRELRALGQQADLGQGCDLAAHHLGAEPSAVLYFVRSWDEGTLSGRWLLHQLEEVWEERLADAVAVQEMLQAGPGALEQDRQDGERAGI